MELVAIFSIGFLTGMCVKHYFYNSCKPCNCCPECQCCEICHCNGVKKCCDNCKCEKCL